jgi:hypothetical protein
LGFAIYQRPVSRDASSIAQTDIQHFADEEVMRNSRASLPEVAKSTGFADRITWLASSGAPCDGARELHRGSTDLVRGVPSPFGRNHNAGRTWKQSLCDRFLACVGPTGIRGVDELHV